MMIDLDFLRDINNTHGHLAGDVVIRAVADILQQSALADEALYTAKHAGRNCVRAYCKSDQVIQPEPHVYNLPDTDGRCVMPLRPKLERVNQN